MPGEASGTVEYKLLGSNPIVGQLLSPHKNNYGICQFKSFVLIFCECDANGQSSFMCTIDWCTTLSKKHVEAPGLFFIIMLRVIPSNWFSAAYTWCNNSFLPYLWLLSWAFGNYFYICFLSPHPRGDDWVSESSHIYVKVHQRFQTNVQPFVSFFTQAHRSASFTLVRGLLSAEVHPEIKQHRYCLFLVSY